MNIYVRQARASDVAAMVDLSEQKRTQYQEHQASLSPQSGMCKIYEIVKIPLHFHGASIKRFIRSFDYTV